MGEVWLLGIEMEKYGNLLETSKVVGLEVPARLTGRQGMVRLME